MQANVLYVIQTILLTVYLMWSNDTISTISIISFTTTLYYSMAVISLYAISSSFIFSTLNIFSFDQLRNRFISSAAY